MKYLIILKHTRYIEQMIDAENFTDAFAQARQASDDYDNTQVINWRESGEYDGPFITVEAVKAMRSNPE